jgi:radical SAM superfamily enzyme YgiQ (UPF0313 family)
MSTIEKKTNMLLVYPDYTDRDVTARATGGNYAEGLASISAVLKGAGHSVNLLHLIYLHSREDYQNKLRKLEKEHGRFDLIGFSVRTTALPDSIEYIAWTKEVCPEAMIITGGYHSTLAPEEMIEIPGVDGVCIGDGEYAELELCDKLAAGEDYYGIESFWFADKSGGLIPNPVRPLFHDIDVLPIPDFDLFDYKNLASMKVDTAIVLLSRGCLYNCTYCGNANFRSVYPNKKIYARFRTPENSILYLKTLLAKYPNIKFLNFRDAIFNMFADWFDEFIELYKQEIHLPFTCNLRFDIITEDTVRRLKEAGCYTIDIGVETGDQDIRFNYLNRYQTDEMMINCSQWFHKYNIENLSYNIIGLPYEDIHKALKTIKLNARMKCDLAIPNIFYPYTGTELYKIAKDAGFLPDKLTPETRVPLVQASFPEHEVLFIEAYFLHFIKRYKRAFDMPGRLGRAYERWLDYRVTGKLVPRKFLVWLHDRYAGGRKTVKNLVINRLPKLYLKLRVAKHKKKAS